VTTTFPTPPPATGHSTESCAQENPEQANKQAHNFVSMMQMITGYWVSACIYAVAKLGIADLLSLGALPIEDLAQRTQTDSDALYRVMWALSSVGVFHELPQKRFEQTPFSALLVSDIPGSVRYMAIMMGEEHYQVWGNLLTSLKTGDRAFETVYGMPVFEYFQKNPESGEIFNNAMTGFASGMHSAVVNVYDFSRFQTLVDVGGGHGALLTNILHRFPNLKGILFDLPHVGEHAPIATELAGRLQTVSGDFFLPSLPGADAYILSTMIHDWSDELSLKILKNIHTAMSDNGTLLLVENVVEADNQPHFGKFLDINMLLMTEGGRERTSAEYRALYQQAGFELTQIIPTNSRICIIEGRKR